MIKMAALANRLRARYVRHAKAARVSETLYKRVERQLLTQERFLAEEKMQSTRLAVKRKLLPPPTRLSPLYDTKFSVLKNLASYRLTTGFVATGKLITDLNYTHNICPNDYICLPDLVGTCTDKSCLYQHKSNYIMSDIEKLADILSYRPSLTGFKHDPSLTREQNDKKCRVKLKQYAIKLLTKNVEKSVETIAQNLVKYVRANKPDHELLTMKRELPKCSHLVSAKA